VHLHYAIQPAPSVHSLVLFLNLESILQPGALSGTYRTGYAEYAALLHALGAREHQSCLLLTSREKPSELGPLEGRSAPVRTLQLTGLADDACNRILEAKEIVGTADVIGALARLYAGNPLALHLVAEPIQELFGGDVAAFLAAGHAFVGGVGKLLEQQFTRSTPLEQTLLYWLVVERELLPSASCCRSRVCWPIWPKPYPNARCTPRSNHYGAAC